MTNITMKKKALKTEIPIKIRLCPFCITTMTLCCFVLAAVDIVLGSEVSSYKAALVRFIESGLSSLSASAPFSKKGKIMNYSTSFAFVFARSCFLMFFS